MQRPLTLKRALLALAALAAFPAFTAPPPEAEGAPVPHRAVYAIGLAGAETKSGVTGASGRMVFEVAGSPCEGYTMSQRLVVRLTDGEGEDKLLDYRVSTFEAGDGGLYRFVSQTYVNEALSEEARGLAERTPGGIRVTLTTPAARTVELKPTILFPSQHLKAILAAARADRRFLSTELYEGAGKGDAADTATTVIGGPETTAGPEALTSGKRSWPISIAYFNKDRHSEPQAGEEVPSYQMSFRLSENGVSRDLVMDYGDYSLSGRMEKLEPLAAEPCPTH